MRFEPARLIAQFAVLAVSGTCVVNGPAQADAVSDFYQGKQITIVIGGGAGGGYDRYARLFARFASKYMPGNPVFVPRNMPAAHGIAATNSLFANVEPDGLTIGALTANAPLDPLLGRPGARYDARQLKWIGSIGKQAAVCGVGPKSAARSVDDLKRKEVVVGAVGATSNSAVWPKIVNDMLGTQFKVVGGYPEGGGIQLALERGEVEGICGLSWSTLKATRPHWLRDGTYTVLLQMAISRHPDLPEVPSLLELQPDPERKKMLELLLLRQETANPFAAPPNIPADRLAALRRAFDQAVTDPEFIAEAKRENLEYQAMSGTDIEKLLADSYATPETIVKKTISFLDATGGK